MSTTKNKSIVLSILLGASCLASIAYYLVKIFKETEESIIVEEGINNRAEIEELKKEIEDLKSRCECQSPKVLKIQDEESEV